MEEILRNLVESSTKKETAKKQYLPQGYYNLRSTWNEPTQLQIMKHFHKGTKFLKKSYDYHHGLKSIASKKLHCQPHSAYDHEEILTSIIALDILHYNNNGCPPGPSSKLPEEDLGSEEDYGLLGLDSEDLCEIVEFVTPASGLASFNLYKHDNSSKLNNFNAMTALATAVLVESGNLSAEPAKLIAKLLKEEILSRFESQLQEYSSINLLSDAVDSDKTESVLSDEIDPMECINLLRLLFQLELSDGTEDLQDYLYSYLEHKLYLSEPTLMDQVNEDEDGGVHLLSFSADFFLYFLTRAISLCPKAEATFKDLLWDRVLDRLGCGLSNFNSDPTTTESQQVHRHFSPINIALRILTVNKLSPLIHIPTVQKQSVRRSVVVSELRALLKCQREDGSFPEDSVCTVNNGSLVFGGVQITSLVVLQALSTIIHDNNYDQN